jgi:hypothetical protein
MKRTKTIYDLRDGSPISKMTAPYDPLEDVPDEELRAVASDIGGEPVIGYEDLEVDGKDLGDFSCQNCEYYTSPGLSCRNKLMKEYSRRPRTTEGNVVVHPRGCCEVVHRLGIYFLGIKRPSKES